MWDSNAPLQLLNSMPKKLSKENLEKIQLVIDADKYKNSLLSGFDLCGMYAPFCRNCKKTSIYPCALAYVNMKKSEGFDVEIDAGPVPVAKKESVKVSSVKPAEEVLTETAAAAEVAEDLTVAEEAKEKSLKEEKIETVKEEVAAVEEQTANDSDDKENQVETQSVVEEPLPEPQPVKRKIRIAVARKKLY